MAVSINYPPSQVSKLSNLLLFISYYDNSGKSKKNKYQQKQKQKKILFSMYISYSLIYIKVTRLTMHWHDLRF